MATSPDGRNSADRVVVFAGGFLAYSPIDPATAQGGARVLAAMQIEHGTRADVVFRCPRDSSIPVRYEEVSDATIVVAGDERYDRELLHACGVAGGGRLRCIARYGVGAGAIDVAAATAAGIVVSHAPEAHTVPAAEWAVSTLLDVAARRIPFHERAAEGREADGVPRLDVSGRTLGLVGTGPMGRVVVRLMAGFGLDVLAYDPSPDPVWAAKNGVTYADLHELCLLSDLISVHLVGAGPVISYRELDLMRPSAVLVDSTGTGATDARAAYRAVAERRIWGYGVDTVWPYPEMPLRSLNITVAPGVAGETVRGRSAMQHAVAQAVVDVILGGVPFHAVNPEAAAVQ